MDQSKRNYLKVHGRLVNALKSDAFASYDLIVIDCPPNFNVVTKTAIVASDYLLVPAKADYLSTMGIDYLVRSLNQLVSEYNEYADLPGGPVVDRIKPEILGIVFTMLAFYDQRPTSALRPFIAQVRSLGLPVLDSYTRESKRYFADAPAYGTPVVLNASSGATQVRTELEDLADEVARIVGL